MDMRILYIAISAFFVIFYPRQITNVICFGRHRDQVNVKSRAAYWGIYSFWTIIFLILCLMMGSAAHVSTVMNKVMYYFILGSGDRDYISVASESDEDTYILPYYTRKGINESFLLKIVQDDKYNCEYYGLEGLTVKRLDKNNWALYLNEEVMGYVEVKNGIFLKKLYYRWDKQKLDQRGKQ